MTFCVLICKFVNLNRFNVCLFMENIFGNRLKLARRMAGLSLQALADKMDNAVTKQALNKYELGKMKPDSDGLLALADALKVSVDYFFHAQKFNFKLKRVAYLKRAKRLLKSDDIAIQTAVVDCLDRYCELEHLLNAKAQKAFFVFDKVIKNALDVEAAAKALRAFWQLGNDPIPDVVALLEDRGYKVFDVTAPDIVFGLSAEADAERLIVLRRSSKKEGDDAVLRRFIALHELAHQSLKFKRGLSAKAIEDLCNLFAEAVLYPEEMLRRDLMGDRTHFYEHELVLLKERWGLSVYSIVHRAFSLGVVKPRVFNAFVLAYKNRGLHIQFTEPGRFVAKELPVRMKRLVFLGLAKEVLTLNEAAYYAGVSAWQLRSHLRLMV